MMRTEQETSHLALQEMLPWYVNQTLSTEQQALVGEHLRGCAQCRQDVAWQRTLAEDAPAAPAGVDMERALARMMPRIDALAPPRRPASRSWMPWALALQGCAIAALAVVVIAPATAPADYRVLGAAGQGAGGSMVVAFRPGATLDDLQRLAKANGARIVDGPTVTGAFVLQVDAARQAQVSAAFRADPAVLLAEPLGRGDAQ
jgi:hypothetical protein